METVRSSVRVLFCCLKNPLLYLHLTSFRKMSVTGSNQGASVDDKMVDTNEHLPHVCILSRMKGIGKFIQDLNKRISVSEIYVSDPEQYVDALELQTAEIVIADGLALCHNYTKMPHLKWAHCTWAGVEPLFQVIQKKPPFIVTRHAHEDFSAQLAEYVMGYILMIELQMKEIWDAQKDKIWINTVICSNMEPTKRFKDLTIGILGVGNMGQAIAKFFKPHGTKVIGLAKSPREMSEFGYFDRIEVSLTEVLSAADYIVNTLPSTPDTIGLLNGDVLQACRKRTVFINVGRGDIVHEDTLLRALDNEWLRHAVLDVFTDEPLSKDSVLWNCNKVTITPHCAAPSIPKIIAKDFVCSYSNYIQNQPMRNLVDWDKGY